MVDELRTKPAPHWGLVAQLIRALLDAFLLYLPLSLMGLVPPTPSFLSIFPTEHYYGTLVWLAPIVLMAELLMQAAVSHTVIRLAGRRSDFDQIVNNMGMAALVTILGLQRILGVPVWLGVLISLLAIPSDFLSA